MCFASQHCVLFSILIFKNTPSPTVCSSFDFEIRLAQQQRALFNILTDQSASNLQSFNISISTCASRQHAVLSFYHLNFQKCSEPAACFTFKLPIVLCAQALCTCWRSHLPKVFQGWSTFTMLVSTCTAAMACTCSSLVWPDGSAPATLASLLCDPPPLQNFGNMENNMFRDFSRLMITWHHTKWGRSKK